MTGQIDITPEERAIVLRILNEIVPDREVRAFGSRVTGKAKPFSDLDLAIMGDEPLPLETRVRLEEAFSESELPWKVDVLDWNLADDNCRNLINKEKISATSEGRAIMYLSDIAEIIMGQSPCGESCNTNGNGIPLLNGPTEFGPSSPNPVQFTTDPRKKSQDGDLLFCVRGSTTGRMNWSNEAYAIGRGIAAIRDRRGRAFQPLLKAIIELSLPDLLQAATGSTFPNVSYRQLAELTLPNIGDESCLKLSSLLGSLDDKIDLNRRMNETLEAMARALFRDWFVDFGPTRAKMAGEAPYLAPELWELFPDRLDDEGKPEGWLDGKLEDIANLQNGYAFKSSDWLADGIPVVKIGAVKPSVVDLKNVSFVDSKFLTEKPNFILKSGDILIGLTGYVGEVGRVPPSQLAPMLNQRVGRFLPNTFFYAYVFCIGRQKEFKEFVENQAHGSAQANVSTKNVITYPTIIPTMNISALFDKNAGLLIEKIDENLSEIDTLTQLRDLLLPKLMSGAISILDAEKMVENAV